MTSARSGDAGMEWVAAAPPPSPSAAPPTRARGVSRHARRSSMSYSGRAAWAACLADAASHPGLSGE